MFWTIATTTIVFFLVRKGENIFNNPTIISALSSILLNLKNFQMPLARAHMEGPVSQPNVTGLLGMIIINICYLSISFARKLS